jgi:hypothetical protein
MKRCKAITRDGQECGKVALAVYKNFDLCSDCWIVASGCDQLMQQIKEKREKKRVGEARKVYWLNYASTGDNFPFVSYDEAIETLVRMHGEENVRIRQDKNLQLGYVLTEPVWWVDVKSPLYDWQEDVWMLTTMRPASRTEIKEDYGT